jgi:hypothetical protein
MIISENRLPLFRIMLWPLLPAQSADLAGGFKADASQPAHITAPCSHPSFANRACWEPFRTCAALFGR